MATIASDRICSRSQLRSAQTELIKAATYLAARHYHGALAGNVSLRVSSGHILCTRHGADKGALTADDLVITDLDGNKVSGEGPPTSELNMHRAAYQAREDVNGVIHAHPPTATAFAAASMPLDSLQLPEMLVFLGPVALVPYATPGTQQLADALCQYVHNYDAFLLENHGALTVGRTVREAALRMELLEHNAQTTLHLRQLGTPYRLSKEQLEPLLKYRKIMDPLGG